MENAELNLQIQKITRDILDDYKLGRDIDHMDAFSQPDRDAVIDIVNKMLNLFFPGFYREKYYKSYSYENRLSILIEDVIYNLQKQILTVLPVMEEYENASEEEMKKAAENLSLEFFRQVPKMRAYIDTDLQATLEGDPAAYSKEEIVLCYPGLMASSINRIAHELFLLKIPLIPRIMTEYAHSRTGIDIHPGAKIGKFFFIDHGTGVVIGETAEIGCHVKIYQGVTIGALSTRGGQMLKGVKRHPTIKDNVTIYAGASILGGETVIGSGSVIGSNVFITSSVQDKTRISNKAQDLSIRTGTGENRSHGEEMPNT